MTITPKILDQLVTLSQNEVKDFEVLVPTLLGLLLYYVFVTGLVNNIFQYSYRGLKQVSRSKLEILFAEQLNYLGIQNLENPDVINRVQRASQWVYETFQTLNDSLFFISNIVQVFVSGAVILSFFPLMIPILLVLTIIKFFPDRYFIKKDFHWQTDNTEKRRIAYSSIVAAQNPSDLQEISIVGGYDFFVQKYENFSKWFNDGLLKIIKEREIVNFK